MGGAVCTGRGWEMGGTVLGGAVRVGLRVWAGLGMCRRGYTCVWAGLKVWAGLGVDLTGVWAGLGLWAGLVGRGGANAAEALHRPGLRPWNV